MSDTCKNMLNSSNNFVSTAYHEDLEGFNENINENNIDVEDPLQSVGISIQEPKYYKLNQTVFAEPLEEVQTPNYLEEPECEDVGELMFIEDVVIKKRAGKRNKYLIDIKDGLTCPMSKCHQQFSTTTLLKAHIRKVHCATAKYVCEECGAAFTARYLLKRHSAVHGDRRVQCAECGKWLSQRTSLSSHLRTHAASRPHGCVSCDKTFLRRASLKRHVKFVHKDGDLSCDLCHERFDTRVQWTRHQSTHKK